MHRSLGLVLLLLAAATALAQDESEAPADPAPAEEPAAPEEPADPAREPYAFNAHQLAADHGHVARSVIGKARDGTEIEMLTIGSVSAEDAPLEWIALVVAGLDPQRDHDESRLALDVASWLAENATDLPARTAVMVIPDAAPGASPPVDEDLDGEADEDGGDDLNGDGTTGWMRVPDVAGNLSDTSTDGEPRAPEFADAAKGKTATHRIVREGRDDDRDGRWNEDGPGGVDFARNFTWRFVEHDKTAGMWPASEAATRALIDLIVAEQRIAVVYEIGGAETIAKLPGWDGPWQKLPDDDKALLDALREEHAAGAVEERKEHAPGGGMLGTTTIHQFGRLWFGRAPLGRSGPLWPAAKSTWPAHLAIRWTRVDAAGAPTGAEIAEIVPAADAKAPPPVTDETPSIGQFLVELAAARARVAFAETHATGSAGVLRLATKLVNGGRLPTHTARGAELKARRPLNVRVVLPSGAKLLAGGAHTQIERLAGGAASDELAWVVAGASGAIVRIECNGPDTGNVVLEERIP